MKKVYSTMLPSLYFVMGLNLMGCSKNENDTYRELFTSLALDTLKNEVAKDYTVNEMQVRNGELVLIGNKKENFNFHEIIGNDSLFNLPEQPDALAITPVIAEQLVLFVDTQNVISYTCKVCEDKEPKNAFPVFLYNPTASYLKFQTIGTTANLLLEAKNEHGDWQAIEYLPKSFPDNLVFSFLLKPNEFALFKIYKYSGDFETELRVKLDLNNAVIYSNVFRGAINKGQFKQVIYNCEE